MGYDVRLEQLDSRPLAVVRRLARSAEVARVVPEACGLVWKVVREQGVKAGRHVTVYRDGLQLEIGVELEAPFSGHGEVVGSNTPAGPVLSATHFGPYDRLHEAHRAVRQWAADHGYEPAGPYWEIYGHWVDEWDTDPEKVRTDVYHALTSAEPAPASGV